MLSRLQQQPRFLTPIGKFVLEMSVSLTTDVITDGKAPEGGRCISLEILYLYLCNGLGHDKQAIIGSAEMSQGYVSIIKNYNKGISVIII